MNDTALPLDDPVLESVAQILAVWLTGNTIEELRDEIAEEPELAYEFFFNAVVVIDQVKPQGLDDRHTDRST